GADRPGAGRRVHLLALRERGAGVGVGLCRLADRADRRQRPLPLARRRAGAQAAHVLQRREGPCALPNLRDAAQLPDQVRRRCGLGRLLGAQHSGVRTGLRVSPHLAIICHVTERKLPESFVRDTGRMPRRLTRRGFLTAAATTAAGLAVPGAIVDSVRAAQEAPSPLPDGLSASEREFVKPRPAKLDLWGRIAWAGYPLRSEPGLNKPVVEFMYADTVLPLLEIVHAEGGNPNNTLWYRVENGYLYTSGVQPIKPYRMPE